MDEQQSILLMTMQLIARQTFDKDDLFNIVAVGSNWEKQVSAYNLCNGINSQSDIAKLAGLDTGNFSRSLSRWIEEGIVFKMGEKPTHIFVITKSQINKKKREKK